jgi:hypothetical protein
MKKLVLTILALCALGSAVGVADAAAWESNKWRSPSNNIRCVWRNWNHSITCATRSPRRSVTLYANGRTAIARAFVPPIGPVLGYGYTWSNDYTGNDTTCTSSIAGITCWNEYAGFQIARENVETWSEGGEYDY